MMTEYEHWERRARAGDGQFAIACGLFLLARAVEGLGVGNTSTNGAIARLCNSLDDIAHACRK